MFSSAMFATMLTFCLSATAPVAPSYSAWCPTIIHRRSDPAFVTGSTHIETVSSHKPLIGGCNGTKFGCCGFPIGDMPRSATQDSCASKNCTACVEAVACLEGSSPVLLNATSHILTYIGDICEDIVGPQAKQCVQITRAAVSAIKYVESGMNASNVCSHLGFCNSATATTVLRST